MIKESLRAIFVSKEKFELPKGATIISKEERVEVQEIENGYLISKSCDIKYTLPKGDDTQYSYYTKKWFTKENPLEINKEAFDEKMIADYIK